MWVARNKNGLLRCSIFKPHKFSDKWIWPGTKAQVMNLSKELFPNLRFEDDPIEVNLFSLQDIEKIKNEAIEDYKFSEGIAESYNT